MGKLPWVREVGLPSWFPHGLYMVYPHRGPNLQVENHCCKERGRGEEPVTTGRGMVCVYVFVWGLVFTLSTAAQVVLIKAGDVCFHV